MRPLRLIKYNAILKYYQRGVNFMIIYLCKNCGGRINENYTYCPYCGKIAIWKGGDEISLTVPAGVTKINLQLHYKSKWSDGVSEEDKKSVKAPEEIYVDVLKFVAEAKTASVSMIQRKFPIGYVKSCKIMDWMEDNGFVSPNIADESRDVLISLDNVDKLFG